MSSLLRGNKQTNSLKKINQFSSITRLNCTLQLKPTFCLIQSWPPSCWGGPPLCWSPLPPSRFWYDTLTVPLKTKYLVWGLGWPYISEGCGSRGDTCLPFLLQRVKHKWNRFTMKRGDVVPCVKAEHWDTAPGYADAGCNGLLSVKTFYNFGFQPACAFSSKWPKLE